MSQEIVKDIVMHSDKLGLPDMLIKISLLQRAGNENMDADLTPLKLYFKYGEDTYAVTSTNDPYLLIWWVDKEMSEMLQGL